MKKTYLAVHFTRGCFLSICWQKALGFNAKAKYYLLAGDKSQVSIFFLHKIKMSKQNSLFIL